MVKLIILWLIAIVSIIVVFGGGAWLFFWILKKGKKNKLF